MFESPGQWTAIGPDSACTGSIAPHGIPATGDRVELRTLRTSFGGGARLDCCTAKIPLQENILQCKKSFA
ncbi:hypothetical protein ACPA2M_05030 [Ectopseudomonas chengduensis]